MKSGKTDKLHLFYINFSSRKHPQKPINPTQMQKTVTCATLADYQRVSVADGYFICHMENYASC